MTIGSASPSTRFETIKWESDEAFFAFMDRLGISGVLYSIIGLFLTFDSLNLDSMAYLLTTVYLVVVGIQGFSDEADARWRRGAGAAPHWARRWSP